MAEITSRSLHPRERLYLFEDFESIAYHWRAEGGTARSGRRTAEHVHRGHAALWLETLSNTPNDEAWAAWVLPTPDTALIGIEVFLKPIFVQAGAYYFIEYIEQARTRLSRMRIVWYYSDDVWKHLNRDNIEEVISTGELRLEPNVWKRVQVEIDRMQRRTITLRVDSEGKSIRKEYFSMGTMLNFQNAGIIIGVGTRTNNQAQLAVDDLSVRAI